MFQYHKTMDKILEYFELYVATNSSFHPSLAIKLNKIYSNAVSYSKYENRPEFAVLDELNRAIVLVSDFRGSELSSIGRSISAKPTAKEGVRIIADWHINPLEHRLKSIRDLLVFVMNAVHEFTKGKSEMMDLIDSITKAADQVVSRDNYEINLSLETGSRRSKLNISLKDKDLVTLYIDF